MGNCQWNHELYPDKMAQDGMEFEEALALATELGYAEADPDRGHRRSDAGRKVAIMASIAFNSRVTFDDVYTRRITKITASDIRYAKETGSVIKLLGVARNTPEGIEVRVHPMLIPERHPLASVNDSFNAVLYMVMPWMMPCSTDAEPENCQRQVRWSEISLILPETSNMSSCAGSAAPATNSCRSKRWMTSVPNTFLRMLVENEPGVLAAVTAVFGDRKVSIEQIIQKKKIGELAEIVVITEKVKERHVKTL